MPRLTPAALAGLARYSHTLPDHRDLRVMDGGVFIEPSHLVMPIYEALPDLLETAASMAAEVEAARHLLATIAMRTEPIAATVADHERKIRLALRLPADAPFDDVLARARHLAELYDGDPERTRDEEVVGG